MSTAVSILGGLGLFLLGMAVMTEGLRGVAGSALRSVLARAAASPAKGAFWGAIVTLIVQSSSATTMTTIGLVSAGLLTFPQALGVVFGANIGTTGTGWLVALLGVKFSLNAVAMPLVFAGAMLKLLGRGRWSGAGGAIAGFALLLVGLTVLQEGMAGLATRINPTDLPAITGIGGVAASWNVLKLVLFGIVMTTVMQSSSAAVAATLSALHAGAIGPDQAAALVVGQNIGSAVSSAIAAIGATTPAKRTAVAHVLFNVLTAAVVLTAFPFVLPLIVRAASTMDATILLAAFHTVYNLLGVGILLPLVRPFARLVEHIVPQRGPILTQSLDRSVLAVPAIAVEAARRTVACILKALCDSLARTAELASRGVVRGPVDTPAVREASDAIDQTRLFLSGLAEPPASAAERVLLADTLHALDHVAELAEASLEAGWTDSLAGDAQAANAAGLCAAALNLGAEVAAEIAQPAGATPVPRPGLIQELARRSAELAQLRRDHRRATLGAAASWGAGQGAGRAIGAVVDQAIARVDHVRRLDRLAYHAWRAAAHLHGETPAADPSQPAALQAPDPPATVIE